MLRLGALGTNFQVALQSPLISHRFGTVGTGDSPLKVPFGMFINLTLGDKSLSTDCTQEFPASFFMGLLVLGKSIWSTR